MTQPVRSSILGTVVFTAAATALRGHFWSSPPASSLAVLSIDRRESRHAMKLPRTKPRRADLKTGESLCEHCTAKCCRYFALPIEAPEKLADYDVIRWFLLHDKATIFVDDGTWYLLVHTTCRHLLPNNYCGIYETRPQICRDYTTDNCEYEDDWTYQQFFETPEQLQEYTEAIFTKPGNGQSIRSPRPTGALPMLSRV